jgi:hypothetical protein
VTAIVADLCDSHAALLGRFVHIVVVAGRSDEEVAETVRKALTTVAGSGRCSGQSVRRCVVVGSEPVKQV